MNRITTIIIYFSTRRTTRQIPFHFICTISLPNATTILCPKIMDNFDKFKKSLPSKGFTNAKNILENDDCDRPACDDTMSALSKALKHSQQGTSTTNHSATTTTTRTTIHCPPTKAAIGTSSWDLLHSMTAWYPDKPTVEDQTLMKQFFTSFARFYPCTWCADDFQANLKKKPVQYVLFPQYQYQYQYQKQKKNKKATTRSRAWFCGVNVMINYCLMDMCVCVILIIILFIFYFFYFLYLWCHIIVMVFLPMKRTDSRESLCMWLCEQHNIVNEKLGKPTFQCSMKNLDERWRKSSDPNCN